MSTPAELKGKQRQPPVVQPASGNSIIINPSQRLNPVIECIRNVTKEFGDILPDYQVGRTTGVLFLSLRYHRLHPEYIHQRIERLGQSYNLRVLLLMCDISEHQEPIRELTKICLLNNITVIVAWSADEAGQYLAAYKQSEHRAPTLIRERIDKTPAALLRTALTSIPRVNKTDVETLRASFGSFAKIVHADAAQLARLPGFGPKKVARLKDAFERPFRTGATTSAFVPAVAVAAAADHPSASASASASAATAIVPTTSAPPRTAAQQRSSNSGNGDKDKDVIELIDDDDDDGDDEQRLADAALGPVWDIELDLNSPSPSPLPSPAPEHPPPSAPSSSKRAREEKSWPWDIERGAPLIMTTMTTTSRREEGKESSGPDTDSDSDMDIAPALRAKRHRA